MHSTNKNSSSFNWEKRINTSNNLSIIYRNFSKYKAYDRNSEFTSRSSTPNYIDNSLTESSDERDSTSSVRGS